MALLERPRGRGGRGLRHVRLRPLDRGEGTYRFKEQWGALPEPLGWCAVAPGAADDGAPAGAAPDGDGEVESDGGGGARALAESLWRRLPLPVANRLGPALRKYIDR